MKLCEKWIEKNGVIRFSVTSDGDTGSEWMSAFGSLAGETYMMLASDDFKPTDGVTTKIAILMGKLFEDGDRIARKIRREAEKRKLKKPNPEVACLIRRMFTDEEINAMGLSHIVTMHEPISIGYSELTPSVLHTRDYSAYPALGCTHCPPFRKWPRDVGFAFEA